MAIDYIMIGSNDLDRSRAYYAPVFAAFGGEPEADIAGYAFSFRFRNDTRAWISLPYDRQPAAAGNGSMPGYRCSDRAEVDAAHAAALANGGSNEGDPGPRPDYGPTFYGAYARDPDGNKMSFFCM